MMMREGSEGVSTQAGWRGREEGSVNARGGW